ncbi:MAG: phosphoglycerate mutase family protein [Sinorhizobium meliloti]|nr:phosphoglycerate mutase family protein [Sinorhizobium meliloti]
MTTTFLLVRHAAHDRVGCFLAGRTGDVPLGTAGREQAQRLAARLAGEGIGSIYASPRKRTQETAAAIAAASEVAEVVTTEALDEVDFGDWSGKTFDVLDTDPLWRRWNAMRSLVRAPGGETMLDVQCRAVGLVAALAQRHGKEKVALVSHADVIKTLVCHILGLSADAWPRFEIAPASVSVLVMGDWGAKILTLNENVS